MMKKCSFCKVELESEPAFEVCRSCGIKIWGEPMFRAISQNMEDARDKGDLYQGSVTETSARHSSKKSFTPTPRQVEELAPVPKNSSLYESDELS